LTDLGKMIDLLKESFEGVKGGCSFKPFIEGGKND
jgi:hypothetical protein